MADAVSLALVSIFNVLCSMAHTIPGIPPVTS